MNCVEKWPMLPIEASMCDQRLSTAQPHSELSVSNTHAAHQGQPIVHSVKLVDLGLLASLDCTAYHELESRLGSPVGQWQSTRETPCAR